MSDARINVACPNCGENYNLLASSVGTWWKCRNDQCRRSFEVEEPAGNSPSTTEEDRDGQAPVEEIPPFGPRDDTASEEGIISLETFAAHEDDTHPIAATNTETDSSSDLGGTQGFSTPRNSNVNSEANEIDQTTEPTSDPQELDTFAVGEPTQSAFKKDNSYSDGSGFQGDRTPQAEKSFKGTENPLRHDRTDSTQKTEKPPLSKKQRLQRRIKWIGVCVLFAGTCIITAIIVFRPQPNEVTDWSDSVRLYEERKWSKAKRSFNRYRENFPESPHAQEIPFFIDMCKAGSDIFSRTGNSERGWRGVQEIYKNHRNNPVYSSYAERFREAITELQDTFIDQAHAINQKIGEITPTDVIKIASSESDTDNDQSLEQTLAAIQAKRIELQTATERLDIAAETLDLLQEVSLANKISDTETPGEKEDFGKNIDIERISNQYLSQRLEVLELFAKLLDLNTQFGPNQIDALYDTINSGLDELQSGPGILPSDGIEDSSKLGTENIEAWTAQGDELLRAAYKREARRITYTPFSDREQFTTLVGLPATNTVRDSNHVNSSASLFVVRGNQLATLQNDNMESSQVYFSIARGILYAFTPRGKFLWARRLGLDSYALPVSVPATTTAPQRIVAVSTIENKLLAINARSGQVDWEYSVNFAHNLLASLTVIRVPKLGGNNPDDNHIVGLLPTATGQIHVLELNRGRTLGVYEVGHPLSQSGVWDPETGYVFFAADAKRVFAISPKVIAERLADKPQEPTPAAPAVLYTNHAAGSLRGPPIVLGSCLITAEIFNLEQMKLRAFEINRPNAELDVFPEIKQPPLKEFAVNGLSWFEPARIPDRLAAITDEGQLGIYGVNLDNITEAMYPLIGSADGGVHSVATLENSRSMVVQSDEQFAWILADGQMQHLFLDIRNQTIEKIWPVDGEDSPVNGYPLHKAQANDWSTTFYIASADLNDSETEFTAVDAATGRVIWNRILGLNFFGDPRPLKDGSVALLDRSGAVVRIKEEDFAQGVSRNTLTLPPLDAAVEIPRSCKREDMRLIRGDGDNLYLVGYASAERRLYAKRVGSKISRWYHTPLPFKPLGNFVIRDGKLVAACQDGLVYFCDFRDNPTTGRTQPFQWDSDGVIDGEEGRSASVFMDPSSDRITDLMILIHGKIVSGLSVTESQSGGQFEQTGRVQVPADVTGPPIISPNGNVCVACKDNSLNWIDLESGDVIHREQLHKAFADAPVKCGDIFCVELNDRSIMGFGVDHRDETRWESEPLHGRIVGDPLLLNGHIVVTDITGKIYAFDPKTGKTIWQTPIQLGPGQIPSAAAVPIGEEKLLVPLIDGSFVQVKLPGQIDDKEKLKPATL